MALLPNALCGSREKSVVLGGTLKTVESAQESMGLYVFYNVPIISCRLTPSPPRPLPPFIASVECIGHSCLLISLTSGANVSSVSQNVGLLFWCRPAGVHPVFHSVISKYCLGTLLIGIQLCTVKYKSNGTVTQSPLFWPKIEIKPRTYEKYSNENAIEVLRRKCAKYIFSRKKFFQRHLIMCLFKKICA